MMDKQNLIYNNAVRNPIFITGNAKFRLLAAPSWLIIN